MTALAEIRPAYHFRSRALNNFCCRLVETARQDNARWFPATYEAHRAAIAGLQEVATQLRRLREALSQYPLGVTQKIRREMDRKIKTQLNAYVV